MSGRSGDLHVEDVRGSRPCREVTGQLGEGLVGAGRVDHPPHGVIAGKARSERATVAQRAGAAFERGEDGTAVLGLVMVLEEVSAHAASLGQWRRRDIGIRP